MKIWRKKEKVMSTISEEQSNDTLLEVKGIIQEKLNDYNNGNHKQFKWLNQNWVKVNCMQNSSSNSHKSGLCLDNQMLF